MTNIVALPGMMVTPVGSLRFPYLNSPDTRFHHHGIYRVILRLRADDPFVMQIAGLCQNAEVDGRILYEKLPRKIRKRYPFSFMSPLFYDGAIVDIPFKMIASGVGSSGRAWVQRPAIFDAQRKPMSSDVICGGSTGKICFTTKSYFITRVAVAGLVMNLKAVQIIDLVHLASLYGFEQEH